MLGARLRAAAYRDTGAGGGIPSDYLVFYTMDNIVGSTLVDEAGNHNGTISGATTGPGAIGDCLVFSGGTDNVAIGDIFNFTGSVDFAFSAWVNTTFSGINNYCFGTNTNTGLYARVDADNTLLVKLDDGANDAFARGSTNLTSGSFFHIVLMNKSNVLTGWVNGSKEIEVSHSVGNMSNDLNIGLVPTGVNGYRGGVDLFRFYQRALTPSEITSLASEA